MKKSILYLFLLLALPSMAQYRGHGGHGPGGSHETASSLTIVAPKHQAFWLFVDDVLQNENAVHSIRINNLWPDEFYIRVELDNPEQECIGRFVDMRYPQGFSIVQHGNLFGFEPTQGNIRPELTMNVMTEMPLPPMPATPSTPQIEIVQPPVPEPVHIEMGMNPRDFDEAVNLLSKESFDDTRLTTAKQIVANNPMTVNQIAQICRLFTYENNKLEWAKFAYPYCVEKNKYYMLNDVFTYDSSKQELNEFIKGL
ncbi:MAG: DUF4476 domain-containing protein [Bacteroidales bacterium]|nr:DUF4476 domain-containing protein [Bacteroidales bacterium]